MREVEGLVLSDKGLDVVPGLRLGSVGKEVHNDGSALDGLLDGEEGLSGNLGKTRRGEEVRHGSSSVSASAKALVDTSERRQMGLSPKAELSHLDPAKLSRTRRERS